jgi:putative ATP-dependent endonuclease of OLD family
MSFNHDVPADNMTPTDRLPILISRPRTVRLLLIVEGGHDIRFLKRISRILNADDPSLPDLRTAEQAGLIAFIPVAGSSFCHWTHRLEGLGVAEFYLLDKEVPPLTVERQRAVEIVNRRSGCRAVLTNKRSIENYLHSRALFEARGIELSIGDDDDLPDSAARCCFERTGGSDWVGLRARTRCRLRNLAKKWLNSTAVERMTPERLEVRDPAGDVRSWLTSVAEMLR